MSVTPRIAAAAMLVGLAIGTAAPASAAPVMSGHYIETDSPPAGVTGTTTTIDWYFTPCGDGCASAATAPGGQRLAQAALVNGQWAMDTGPDDAVCEGGTRVPRALRTHSTWDPITLAGTAVSTYVVPACGHETGHQQKPFNLQLKQAP
jgi:hypothetical protein